MSVRRQTANRRTLCRVCGTCGRKFTTTASTPWMRQIMEVDEDGKRHQYTRYFCSSKCFSASYKHIGWYDGKAQERRREKEARRDTREKNRRYYQANREQILEKKREFNRKNPGHNAKNCAFQRKKRRMMAA